jgi:multicomponent Na+:H+ antiporter subunit D
MFALGLFLCGLFIKAGLFPFCGWLPDAYQAAFPPAGILMAGIVTKVVGVYALMRLVSSVFPFYYSLNLILMAVGVASVLFGALTCLTQNNFRRMLAYSSISQVGYIILGLGCGTTLGLAGAAFHLFNHAIFKSLLFINSQAVESQTGTNDMDKLSGLATRMPITGFSSIIGSLAVAGIPPLSGFWSKLIIVIALWSSGHHAISIIAILTSVITLAYFLSMQRRVFFGSLNDNFINIREAGLALTLPSLLLTAIILGIGIYFPRLLNTAIFPLATISGG